MAEIIAWFAGGPHDNESLLIEDAREYRFEDGSRYTRVGTAHSVGGQPLRHQFQFAGFPGDPSIADPPSGPSRDGRTFGDA
ncbi:hypothetical protein [Agromyces sp. NDB4Y10]|uniref:hypothetical protein n=1 Tax=Agromyces sp. NDB4Y10 TaxID=1775951 RepID=UPI0012F7E351|nr:hypothetical protein [Agromyces sp. NDB4Y10]